MIEPLPTPPTSAAANSRGSDRAKAVSLWGRNLSVGPTEENILAQVRSAELVAPTAPLELLPLARNPIRCDYFRRATFRVQSGGTILCHLTVGRNLEDLYQRSRDIAQVCPEIACRPLFWRETDGWQFFGVEFCAGENLETLLLRGELSLADATTAAEKVVRALAATRRPSSIDAAQCELNALFDQLCALPLFDGLDQSFLDQFIFPGIRTGLLAEAPRTQWTNGDLIARNILVDAHGNVRLVDYEFAEETHFFASDAWRWRSFSTLPKEVRELPALSDEFAAKPWLESLALLRQMMHQYVVNGAQIAVEDSRDGIRRLIEIARLTHANFRTSAFFRALAGEVTHAARATTFAQLFWSKDGIYHESRSQTVEYALETEAALTFHVPQVRGKIGLRFDPAAKQGLLKISALRVRETQNKRVLISLSEATDWKGLRLDGGLMRLLENPALNLISLDPDPHLSLPEIDLGEAVCDLVCEVWLCLSSELKSLPGLLPKGSMSS